LRLPARLLVAFLLALAPGVVLAAGEPPWRDPDQHFFQTFLGDLPSELQAAANSGKRGVLLVYEMEGCPFCVWLHRTALREAPVQDYYRRHFSIFRIDIRGSTVVKGFDGREGLESAFATQQKIRGTPTSIFYDLAGREVTRFTGAPRDRQEFLLLGEFVAEGHYRKMKFPDYRRSRSGP
jgi:thioredoxin-related protein